jgi:hypothetical protein
MPSPTERIASIEHMGCDDQFCGFEPWESSPVLMWKTFDVKQYRECIFQMI